jgi:hypothetical protein
MPAVDEVDDEPKGFSFREVSADELPPPFALGTRNTSITESWQVDEVQAIINKVIVELLRLARSAARACEGPSTRQQIEQRALSYV